MQKKNKFFFLVPSKITVRFEFDLVVSFEFLFALGFSYGMMKPVLHESPVCFIVFGTIVHTN